MAESRHFARMTIVSLHHDFWNRHTVQHQDILRSIHCATSGHSQSYTSRKIRTSWDLYILRSRLCATSGHLQSYTLRKIRTSWDLYIAQHQDILRSRHCATSGHLESYTLRNIRTSWDMYTVHNQDILKSRHRHHRAVPLPHDHGSILAPRCILSPCRIMFTG